MQDFPTFFQSFSINQRSFCLYFKPCGIGLWFIFMLLFFSLRPFPRHRMPAIFFALALLALLTLFTSIVPIVPIVPCKFLHGKVDHLDKLRLLLGQLCQVCHAFFHHFIDRLDKNFSYSLYISYSFLIHYRSYQPLTSVYRHAQKSGKLAMNLPLSYKIK